MTRLLTAIALYVALTACASAGPVGWEFTPDLWAAQPAPWRAPATQPAPWGAPAIRVVHLRLDWWRKFRPSENIEDRRRLD
jgi:hypothetical protein